jgi:hypothetical protein
MSFMDQSSQTMSATTITSKAISGKAFSGFIGLSARHCEEPQATRQSTRR